MPVPESDTCHPWFGMPGCDGDGDGGDEEEEEEGE